MFFYWQLGAAAGLAQRYDLGAVDMAGASAGALAATLAACRVDGAAAAEAAFQLSLDHKVWDNPAGLGGIWGGLIRLWSTGFARQSFTDFASRDDLIDCCLASVHIPWFMDGHPQDLALGGSRPTVWLDYTDDPAMKKDRLQFLSLGAKGEGPSRTWQWIKDMMAAGELFVSRAHQDGSLSQLHSAALMADIMEQSKEADL
eukprot:SM000008S22237  [mRNA]  locus=s8:570189:571736:- [translate_table: standard]